MIFDTHIKPSIALSPMLHEVLQALNNGAMLVQDNTNALIIGPYRLQPRAAQPLMEAGYLERLDKKRDIRKKGNGYVISELGRRVVN